MSHRVQVSFTDDEFEGLKSAAGFESLSGYCRRVIVGGVPSTPGTRSILNPTSEMPSPPDQIEEQSRESIAAVKDRKLPEGVTVGMPERKSKTCAHGKRAGQNCWQCGGKVVVE